MSKPKKTVKDILLDAYIDARSIDYTDPPWTALGRVCGGDWQEYLRAFRHLAKRIVIDRRNFAFAWIVANCGETCDDEATLPIMAGLMNVCGKDADWSLKVIKDLVEDYFEKQATVVIERAKEQMAKIEREALAKKTRKLAEKAEAVSGNKFLGKTTV